MSHPPPDAVAEHLVAIGRALRKRGIPRRVRYRLLDEWKDHAHDLYTQFRGAGQAEQEAAGHAIESLGAPVELAKAAARRLPWVARWPLISFILLPILGFPVLGIVYALFMSYLLKGFFAWHGDKSSTVAHAIMEGTAVLGFYGVPIVIAAGLLWRALRAGLGIAWPALAALLLFVIHAPLIMELELPQTPTGSGSVGISTSWVTAPGHFSLEYKLLPSMVVFIPIGLHVLIALIQRLRVSNRRTI